MNTRRGVRSLGYQNLEFETISASGLLVHIYKLKARSGVKTEKVDLCRAGITSSAL